MRPELRVEEEEQSQSDDDSESLPERTSKLECEERLLPKSEDNLTKEGTTQLATHPSSYLSKDSRLVGQAHRQIGKQ